MSSGFCTNIGRLFVPALVRGNSTERQRPSLPFGRCPHFIQGCQKDAAANLPLGRKTAGLNRDPRQGSARHPVRLRRKVEIGSGSSDATRPVVVIETWIEFARLAKVRPSAGSWGPGQ
ncbi:hypothetical protein CN089_19430 [Sinorhizobium meliloti]|nr:hypothetical protein CN173_32175 [Sinorhizobium meliloti]RVO92803.1 hypothetical protein CN089_19430 [Sinorhizobium meliloti]